MKKIYSSLVLIFCFQLVSAQKLRYDVRCANAVHHEAAITLTVTGIPIKPAVFKMSRSSPGRYATHEFGKNVYDVKATDAAGKALAVNRIDGDAYEVPRHKGYVQLSYTLYGNYADGTYVGIDATNLHFNMPAAFMWMKGLDQAPIEINFHLPAEKNWTIATQLKPTANAHTFTAPNLQYFMDSPTKIGNLHFREWTVTNSDNKNYRFRIALDATASDAAIDSFTTSIQRIVQEAKLVFTTLPNYDYGMYTFIISANPYVHGDGMEHRNSTMISLPFSFDNIWEDMDVYAHEFFHCWNVERIRPKTLEPFNFEKSNMSNELWFAEGFTQYYGQLLMVRSGLLSDTSYAGLLGNLVYTKLNTIGAKYYTPIQASNHAVFVDAGVSVDRTNYPNMFTSYYPYGAAIALVLDLELRSRYHISLDAYMQLFWNKFGKTEIAYTVNDLQNILAELTNDKPFAGSFFNRYVYGHEPIDYKSLLAPAGYLVKKLQEGTAWLGGRLQDTENGVTIVANTIRETPLYIAGLDVDDVIVEFDNSPIKKQAVIKTILSAHKPGDVVNIAWLHHGQLQKGSVTLTENPAFTVVPYERAGLPLNSEMLQFRKDWLGSKL